MSKPSNFDGYNPAVRNKSSPAEIIRYDGVAFDFLATYFHAGRQEVCRFQWHKGAEQYGSWRQERPEASGQWYMEKVTDDIFTGWSTAKDGKAMTIWLKAKDD